MSLWKRAGCQTESKAFEKSIVDKDSQEQGTFEKSIVDKDSQEQGTVVKGQREKTQNGPTEDKRFKDEGGVGV